MLTDSQPGLIPTSMRTACRDPQSEPTPAARIDIARRQIKQALRHLEDHLKTLAHLVGRAEKQSWPDPSGARTVEELKALFIQRSAAVFRALGVVHLVVEELQHSGWGHEAGTPGAPPPRRTRSWQNRDLQTPAARLKASYRQIVFDCWLLQENLKTLAGLVRQAEGPVSSDFCLRREIGQLDEAVAQRSAEIFRAVGDVCRGVFDHKAEAAEAAARSDKTKISPQGMEP